MVHFVQELSEMLPTNHYLTMMVNLRFR